MDIALDTFVMYVLTVYSIKFAFLIPYLWTKLQSSFTNSDRILLRFLFVTIPIISFVMLNVSI